MKLELNPWTVPNFVTLKMPAQPRQNGFHESPSFALKDVGAQDLAEQCDRFRASVFEKAGKTDPDLIP